MRRAPGPGTSRRGLREPLSSSRGEMQNRSRNAFVLAIVAGLLHRLAVRDRDADDEPRPGPQGRRPAHLRSEADREGQGGLRIARTARSKSCASASTSSVSRDPKSSVRARRKSRSRCRNVQNVQRREEEVGKTAQLYFYDWEPNVIGPNGEPAPTDATVDRAARTREHVDAGLPEYQAVLRAAKRPAILPPKDSDSSTYQPGLHARRRTKRRAGRRRGASTASGTCSTKPTRRCCAAPKPPRPALTRHGLKIPARARS